MPIYLATLPEGGGTVVNGHNAAIVYAEDTSLARTALNAAYDGGQTNPWGGCSFVEMSQVNLSTPIFLARPTPIPGEQGNVEA